MPISFSGIQFAAAHWKPPVASAKGLHEEELGTHLAPQDLIQGVCIMYPLVVAWRTAFTQFPHHQNVHGCHYKLQEGSHNPISLFTCFCSEVVDMPRRAVNEIPFLASTNPKGR